MVKVKDLKDQTGVLGPHPDLVCVDCGHQYSANKGDYFLYPAEHEFTCEECGEPLKLAIKRTYFEVVEP